MCRSISSSVMSLIHTYFPRILNAQCPDAHYATCSFSRLRCEMVENNKKKQQNAKLLHWFCVLWLLPYFAHMCYCYVFFFFWCRKWATNNRHCVNRTHHSWSNSGDVLLRARHGYSSSNNNNYNGIDTKQITTMPTRIDTAKTGTGVKWFSLTLYGKETVSSENGNCQPASSDRNNNNNIKNVTTIR